MENTCEKCMFYTMHRRKNATSLKPYRKGYCLCDNFDKKKYEPHHECMYFLPLELTNTYI